MGRAMIRAVAFATVLLVGGAAGTSNAGATPTSHHTKATGYEHCFWHSPEIVRRNRDDTVTSVVKTGVKVCRFDGRTVSITPVQGCTSPSGTWTTCTASTRVSSLAGKPLQRSVVTVAHLSRKVGRVTRSRRVVRCFHIRVTTGDVRGFCREHSNSLSSRDELILRHSETTFRFNRGKLTRWGKGGIEWGLQGFTTVSQTPIADCGSPGLWKCTALPSILPLAGHPDQIRDFTLATFTQADIRRGMAICFHMGKNGNVHAFCRIKHP